MQQSASRGASGMPADEQQAQVAANQTPTSATAQPEPAVVKEKQAVEEPPAPKQEPKQKPQPAKE